MIRLRTLLKSVRYLFLFKSPSFDELDFIDLIIEDRPVFLVSWKLKNGHKLSIPAIKKTYNQNGSILVQLPKKIDFIKLTAYNVWKKSHLLLELKHTQLDSNTSRHLIQQLQPITSLKVKEAILALHSVKPVVLLSRPIISSNPIQFQKKFHVKTEKFKYP